MVCVPAGEVALGSPQVGVGTLHTCECPSKEKEQMVCVPAGGVALGSPQVGEGALHHSQVAPGHQHPSSCSTIQSIKRSFYKIITNCSQI
jgi:hypothetical protein